MKVGWRARAGGALGRLLLVVMLALGVFAMHSTGHPSESAHSIMSTASHSTATDTTASAHDPMSPPAGRVTGGQAAVASESESASSHQPAMAMDMLALCVAVLLGTWVLTALLKSALARHQGWPALLLAQVAAVSRPNRPPRGPDPTRLSVLRL
ncbi:DUF6153 family protein [Streptomyces europaeiscabiei]|uniref:hypothetical protein n=1 Tax=Streptomyces europaeiscabiei TaxID=146819 RepID=UPI000B122010|nr:hypothetical protein [Streptomyces europaeiscabiei]MDX2767115.1 hypothetical protein [Streptomyces europaeiscabiei]MDX3670786.1 hypothetical protein [Streptomyces europaeiscabiei]MDX3778106.1 hypothetical protein [Streptomyces europaeiscabiei]MDX3845934.1 hypothetical protein [Streptomyces europaeiscabiei]MDX3865144.1 hypothetical protein [Streptomyces europaeiscabiei]